MPRGKIGFQAEKKQLQQERRSSAPELPCGSAWDNKHRPSIPTRHTEFEGRRKNDTSPPFALRQEKGVRQANGGEEGKRGRVEDLTFLGL